jgi:hypothetical protein
MPYFPPNKVTVNLYTNGGEFFIQGTNTPYTGYYHKLSSGKLFTGKNPNESYPQPLTPRPQVSQTQLTDTPLTVTLSTNPEAQAYNTTKKIDPNLVQTLPTPYYPQPTTADYQTGEFQRYFTKKVNETIFLEINQLTYNKIVSRDSSIIYSLYTPFSLPWQLTGTQDQVEQTNRNIVLYTEAKFKVYGLDQFLKNKLEFYQGG